MVSKIRVPRYIKKHWPKKAQRRYILAITPKPWHPTMLVNKGDSFLYCEMYVKGHSLFMTKVFTSTTK